MSAPVDPQRWARIADLFDRALSVRSDDRAAWLVAICGDDRALHDEVTSLLRAHDRAGGFISSPARSGAPPSPDHIEIPSVPIGPYRVQRVLGAGGMGVVYLAEDPRLGRHVALKALAPGDGDPARAERLRREARLAASLAHPNVAAVYALEEYGGQLYMVSEYVPGETLRDRLGRGPVPVREAVDIVATMARALAAAHARGIVHRDLKPENVVRTPDGTLKILDFGLATTAEPSLTPLTVDGAALGTPAYMSPEQIRGTGVDGRSDQFALGIILYELVSGTHPFLGRTPAATFARILEAAAEPIRLAHTATDDEHLQDRLNAVIARLLQKAPDHRYVDTAAAAAALDRVLQAAPEPAAPEPIRPGRAWWWWQFHQAAVAGSYALLLVPLWRLRRIPDAEFGVWLFLLALVAAVTAGALRLHLWFAAREYPNLWLGQHTRARRWVRAADITFALVLMTKGIQAARLDDPSAPLLVAAAVAAGVAFLVIEPATTRAAHGQP